MMDALSPLAPRQTAAPAADAADADRQALREAGIGFEALILAQMLQGAMPDANATAGAATQTLARQLAETSPFGIAAMLEAKRQ